MDSGDRLLQLDGRAMSSAADVATVLGAHRAGDAVPVVFESRGTRQQATIKLGLSPRLEGILYEEAGQPVTAQMRTLRTAWMGGGK